MKIVVCIKQVPNTTETKINPNTNTFIREGVESTINSFDYYAIEEGLRLKEKYGGTVTVLSMGPPQSIKALREALSYGIDNAVLLSCKQFAGADTLATSYTLATAIKKMDADIILLGKQTSDGNTGQVGPQLAEFLNIRHITNICGVEHVNKGESVIVEKLIEDGVLVLKSNLPIVLTVIKDINKPRFPTLRGRIRAKKIDIPIWDADSMIFDPGKIGINGSPTTVQKIFRPSNIRGKGKIFTGTLEENVENLLYELRNDRKVL